MNSFYEYELDAWCIMFGELNGGKFNWETFDWNPEI